MPTSKPKVYLAPSLRRLFREIDARWPRRDHGSDGWIGDKAHQQRTSDHNPDDRGIVHAIDIDKDGVLPNTIVALCARNDRPASYVIWNRQIWSRSHGWKPRRYTGSNPHTSHIHVSIQYGTKWEADTWEWGIADLAAPPDLPVVFGSSEDMTDWHAYVDRSNAETVGSTVGLALATAVMRAHLR